MLQKIKDAIDVRWLLMVLSIAVLAGGAGFAVGAWLGS
jgi:hypothetical protein